MKMEWWEPALCSTVPAVPCHQISGGVGKLAVNKRWLCSLIHQHSTQPATTAESDPTERQSIDTVSFTVTKCIVTSRYSVDLVTFENQNQADVAFIRLGFCRTLYLRHRQRKPLLAK
jgi:hypothetical protein